MYFNNVHILWFVAIAILGLINGKIVAWCNIRLPEDKKILSFDFFKSNKEGLKYNYVFMISIALIYIFLLYKFGIKYDDFFKNLELVKFLILIPMLILALSIDLKHRIIPNRLNLTMFETGLIITFLYGINNVNMAKDYILGMGVGTLIFLIVLLIGRIITGKEAMGLGDVKFVGALGLFFGINGIIEISLLAFIIGAIISIIVIFIRNIILKSKDEYIAFGPFISIASICMIFCESGIIIEQFLFVCKLLSDKILML